MKIFAAAYMTIVVVLMVTFAKLAVDALPRYCSVNTGGTLALASILLVAGWFGIAMIDDARHP